MILVLACVLVLGLIAPAAANEVVQWNVTSFSEAARESAHSRVYAGIHFRSACEDGLALGRKVGQRTAATYLQPMRK